MGWGTPVLCKAGEEKFAAREPSQNRSWGEGKVSPAAAGGVGKRKIIHTADRGLGPSVNEG